MNNISFIATAASTVAALIVLTIFMVRHYKRSHKVDATAARHLEFHNKYVAEATELGIKLTGKETSREVSQLIGQHNRQAKLDELANAEA